jgi:cytochrome c
MRSFPTRTFMLAALLLVAPGAGTAARADGDADAGKEVFKKCAVCHSPQAGQNKVGPSLAGVVGRKAGSVPNYSYSTANKESGLTWDEPTLTKYLENPREFVKGTKMVFPGLKTEKERQDVIAYLKTLQ